MTPQAVPSRRRAIAQLAAFGAIAMIVVAAVISWRHANPSPQTTSPAATTNASPEAVAGQRGMVADELAALLTTGLTAPTDVLADVTVNGKLPMPAPDCKPNEPCPVPLGVIESDLGGVFVYAEPDDWYPDLTQANLSAPVALRLGPGPSVQFLGHVDESSPSGTAWSVPLAAQSTAATALGDVLAIEGWLSAATSPCGPAPQPGPRIDPPFDCAVSDVIAPTADPPPHLTGRRSDENGIRVQKGAYSRFAPGDPGTAAGPQFGTYLIERVANRNDNCTGCDGWLVVGRLDP